MVSELKVSSVPAVHWFIMWIWHDAFFSFAQLLCCSLKAFLKRPMPREHSTCDFHGIHCVVKDFWSMLFFSEIILLLALKYFPWLKRGGNNIHHELIWNVSLGHTTIFSLISFYFQCSLWLDAYITCRPNSSHLWTCKSSFRVWLKSIVNRKE